MEVFGDTGSAAQILISLEYSVGWASTGVRSGEADPGGRQGPMSHNLPGTFCQMRT